MKYREWKRWAKREKKRYEDMRYRPVKAVAFQPPDWTPDDDAQPWVQAAFDYMAIGYGGELVFPPMRLKISKTLELTSSGVGYYGAYLQGPDPEFGGYG